MLSLIFLVAAIVLFILAGVGLPSPPRFNLLAFGLACWAISVLIGAHPLGVG